MSSEENTSLPKIDSGRHRIASEVAEIIHSAQILVVDDLKVMSRMIGLTLKKGGYTNISYAYDGDEALDAIASDPPDLVILDINMPRMNGYEVCRRLRSDPETRQLPILVQSAAETDEERVKVFEAGGTDFVSKPINHPEMLARVALHLENRFLIKSLTRFRARVQSELTLAREMQQDLLPSHNDIWRMQKKYGVVIDSLYRASSELGGDLWGLIEVSDTCLGVYTLDLVGHGVGAAMNTFRVQAVMNRHLDDAGDPAAFMTALNSELVEMFPTGQYATMFYGVIDIENDTLTWSGGAAPRPFVVLPRSGNEPEIVDTAGLPVGVVRKPGYMNLTRPFVEDELLFAYSDVLVESPDKHGNMLGEEGLQALIADSASQAIDGEVLPPVLHRFFERGGDRLDDDLTAVSICRCTNRNAVFADDRQTQEKILVIRSGETQCKAVTRLDSNMFDATVLGSEQEQDEIARVLQQDGQQLGSILFDASVSKEELVSWLEFVKGHKNLQAIPVIAIRPMEQAMDAGKLYGAGVNRVMEVGVHEKSLQKVLRAMARDRRIMVNMQQSLDLRTGEQDQVSEGEFRFQSRAEAYRLAKLLSLSTPDPVRTAIGLTELLVNAVEHGCLQVGKEEKAKLIDMDVLDRELDVRHTRAEFKDRFATIRFKRGPGYSEFRIEDPGDGFDYDRELDNYEASMTAASGRGLFMARELFTSLDYSGKGNIVTARIVDKR